MTRTLTAMYDSRAEAERAREQLAAAGIGATDVNITAAETDAAHHEGHEGGFLRGLKNFFMGSDDHHAYEEGLRRGSCLLTLQVDEDEADRAIEVLDRTGAVDLDAREAEWRGGGWQPQPLGGAASERTSRTYSPLTGSETTEADMTGSGISASGYGASGTTGQAMHLSEGDADRSIPVAEERLVVGKRDVDRGTVRVRSYVVSEPVREQVSLREEHVSIERTPVNDRMPGSAAGVFEERSFEVSEHAEEAVVGKETVVTEEIHVRKDVDQRTETIEDSVRRTEVDVDDSRGRTLGDGDRGSSRPL